MSKIIINSFEDIPRPDETKEAFGIAIDIDDEQTIRDLLFVIQQKEWKWSRTNAPITTDDIDQLTDYALTTYKHFENKTQPLPLSFVFNWKGISPGLAFHWGSENITEDQIAAGNFKSLRYIAENGGAFTKSYSAQVDTSLFCTCGGPSRPSFIGMTGSGYWINVCTNCGNEKK